VQSGVRLVAQEIMQMKPFDPGNSQPDERSDKQRP